MLTYHNVFMYVSLLYLYHYIILNHCTDDEDDVGSPFIMNRAEPMSAVFNTYARRKGIDKSSLNFYFGDVKDKQISPNDTPDSLQLDDDCYIVSVPFVTVRVKDSETFEETKFKVNMISPMSKVLSSFASRKGVEESSLQFSINGKRILPTDTPSSLKLVDNDQIIVNCTSQQTITQLENKIIIVIVKDSETGEETKFKINRYYTMSKVFRFYASRKRVEEVSLHFSVNGKRILPTDTPNSLQLDITAQLEGEAVIDVKRIILVYMEEEVRTSAGLITLQVKDEIGKCFSVCSPMNPFKRLFAHNVIYLGEVTLFKMNRYSTLMLELFKAYAKYEKVDESTVRFFLDGEIIQHNDTPLSLDLNDDDQIDARRVAGAVAETSIDTRTTCSQNTCTRQQVTENPEDMLSAFDKLTKEQKNDATATTESRTEDPLKEWAPPSRDECPICFVPLPIDDKATFYRPCCGKIICKGCIADQIHMLMRDSGDEMQEEMINPLNKCMLCRTEAHGNSHELNMKAAHNGWREAMVRVGKYYLRDARHNSFDSVETRRKKVADKQTGIDWLRRASHAGSGKAAEKLGDLVLETPCQGCADLLDAHRHFRRAVKLGRVQAYVKIGNIELNRGEVASAMDNYRKAAICGVKSEGLVKVLKRGFMDGYITRDEYFSTLFKHYKANDEMNSESRKRSLYKW